MGDIVFTLKEGVSCKENYGLYLPTARYGISSLYAYVMMSGPRLKRNYELRRAIRFTDVATPTITSLLGFPLPRNSEGAELLEAFSEDFIKHVLRIDPIKW